MDTGKKIKAIGLVSGGLDSMLAVAVLKRQGIDLVGLYFFNGFAPGAIRRRIYDDTSVDNLLAEKAGGLSRNLGIPVEAVDVSVEFLDLLVSPRHGYGANVNPCIDCRIFMLERARDRMELEGADFVFTGEVLGQRPMSQYKLTMDTVERRSGLEGLLLRPLSARLLPPTIPEEKGWVNRDELLDIQGRSRKRQIQLAGELGIEGYGQPAGGCTLTDANYAVKFRDFMEHGGSPSITPKEAILLAVGRHFRLSPQVKIVVGREEAENLYLEKNWGDDWLAAPVEHPGPTVLIMGEAGDEELRIAAAVTARYSDAKRLPNVKVMVKKGERERIYEIAPAGDEELERYRI